MYSPNKLDEMIGLEKIKEQIRISVAAALAEDRPMYHVLMHGPPGTGKTTMASIIANMMNANLEYTVGNGLRVKRTVMNLNYRDVVFIDEIHRVRLEEEEKMYAPMLDFVYIENEGLYGTTLEIPPFTLIGATTSVGSLSKPLVDRFPLQFEFPFYTLEELTQIVTQAAEKENIKATEEALIKLATASRDTPD